MTMQKKSKEQYSTLGTMAKEGNYATLLDCLLRYEANPDGGEMKLLTDTKDRPYSELDELLYHLPRFAERKEKKKKGPVVEEIETNFLDTILLDENVEVEVEPRQELLPYFLEVVNVILRNGGNPNTTIKNGITPFMLACTVNNEELIKLMLDSPYKFEDLKTGEFFYKRPDLSLGDGRGNRPFYYATMTEATYVMKTLVLEYGVDPNYQYFLSDNKTVFHYVCQNLTDKLIVDVDGLTFKQGENETKEKAIDMLMELGVDPTIMDEFECTPEEYVPTLDDDMYVDYKASEEEVQIWEDTFIKVGNYRKAFEENKTLKPKF